MFQDIKQIANDDAEFKKLLDEAISLRKSKQRATKPKVDKDKKKAKRKQVKKSKSRNR